MPQTIRFYCDPGATVRARVFVESTGVEIAGSPFANPDVAEQSRPGLFHLSLADTFLTRYSVHVETLESSVYQPYGVGWFDGVAGQSVYLRGTPSPIADEVDTKLTASHGTGSWQTGSGGAGGAITILPVYATIQTEPVPATKLIGYTDCDLVQRISLFDAKKVPVNCTGKTLKFFLEAEDGTAIGNADVTASGTNMNNLAWTITKLMHATAGAYCWSIREMNSTTEDDRPLAHGEYVIRKAAGP